MFAALFRSRQQADSVSMVLSFVLAGLGGSIQVGIRPIYRYKGFLGTLSRLTPHANALEGFRRLMIEGQGLVNVLPQVGFLVGLSAICFLVAVWRFRYN
jgi:ABC-2 type transport system permease protein